MQAYQELLRKRNQACSNQKRPEPVIQQDSAKATHNGYEVPEELHGLLAETKELCQTLKVIPQIELNGTLGEGGFAEVFKGLIDDSASEQAVAVKSVKVSTGEHWSNNNTTHTASFHKSNYMALLTETRILSRISSSYIVKFVGVHVEPTLGLIQLVMEYCPYDNLKTHLESISKTSLANLLKISYQIACGVAAIHRMGMIHCDLKPTNILIAADNRIRISDFGGAVRDNEESNDDSRGIGTLLYMAPERLGTNFLISIGQHVKLTTSGDIYSLALIINEVYRGRASYEKFTTEAELVFNILNYSHRDSTSYNCPKKVSELISRSWSQNPVHRPNAEQICEQLQEANRDHTDNDLNSAISF